MTVTQVADLTNSALKESIGETAVINEDLSNVVDIGRAVMDANAVDNYVRSLVNHIGRVVFWDRPYVSTAPSLMMDAWRYGSIKEKIRTVLPESVENPVWQLEDGVEYSPFVFHQPQVSAKFFNGRVTHRVEQTIADEQVEESFSNSYQHMAFISMLVNHRANKLTVDNDNLIARTVATGIANAYSGSGLTKINLLGEYNTANSTNLDLATALRTEAFLRYTVYRMGLVMDQLRRYNKFYNTSGITAFTPRERLKVVYLTDLARSAGVYLHDAPNVFNTGNLALPNADIVSQWQGMGTTASLADRSSIKITHSGINSGNAVTATGILAVMFDEEAMGVTNYKSQVTSQYNPRTHTTNFFDDRTAGYFNDFDEQCVVFYGA